MTAAQQHLLGAARLAKDAALVILSLGKCESLLRHDDGRVCMWGAIFTAHGLGDALVVGDGPELRRLITAAFNDPVVQALQSQLVTQFDEQPIEVVLPNGEVMRSDMPLIYPGALWNDTLGVTAAEVAVVLLRAACELADAAEREDAAVRRSEALVAAVEAYLRNVAEGGADKLYPTYTIAPPITLEGINA